MLPIPNQLVPPEAFIDRGEAQRRLEATVFAPQGPLSAAIFGQPRVGKTSLAHEVVRRWVADSPRTRISVKIDCMLLEREPQAGAALMLLLVEQLYRELQGMDATLPDDHAELLAALRAMLSGRDDVPGYSAGVAQTAQWIVGKMCTTAGVTPVIVLDEFDELAGRFDGAINVIPGWMADPDTPFSLIVISRRRISDIEEQSAPGSGWGRNFQVSVPVGMFDDRGMEEIVGRAVAQRGQVWDVAMGEAEALLTTLDFTVGRHPMLVGAFLYAYAEAADGQQAVGAGLRAARQQEEDLFPKVVNRFEADGLLPSLLAFLFSPRRHVSPRHIRTIQQYELASNSSRAMSPDFLSFLRAELRTALQRESDEYTAFRDVLEQVVRAFAMLAGDQLPDALAERVRTEFEPECRRQSEVVGVEHRGLV
jgi:hypothetical protein